MKKWYFLAITPILLTTTVLALNAAKETEKTKEVVPVASVDLKQYTGKWYEIAKYPNRFEKKCVTNITANYTQKDDGRIEVVNQCLEKNGEINTAKGEAKIVDKTTNAKLKVRFAPGFLSFVPFVWADYWIIDLDKNYRYAVVGTPSRDYLWILSRTPELDETTYQNILERIKNQGFDPNKLVKTPQSK